MASFLAIILSPAYLLARQPAKYNHKISESFLFYLTLTLTVPLLIIIASRTGWLLAALIGFVCIPALLIQQIFDQETLLRMVCSLLSVS